MENGGAAGAEETGVLDGQMRKRALISESAAPLHMFTEAPRLTATSP
jgi:hypothetical protein